MKIRRWVPPLAWAGVILLATSLPGKLVPPEISRYDKITHFVVYGILAALLCRDIAMGARRWQAALLAVVGACVVGAADEWHQQFIPGRMSDPVDFGADAIGASVGAVAFALAERTRARTIVPR